MASAGPAVDMELKKAFQDLQSKMIQTTQQLKMSDMQVEQLKRQIQHSKLVEQELKTLPEGVNTYEGVGRMFICQPVETIKSNLGEKVKNAEAKIKTIETNKQYLERSIKESEDNLRELVLSKTGRH
ncbi:prefoldin subunit 1 [Lingula anatina]|uniref:Prefoldin subunit 1 n=1 Tax=Lingula anatina TaxID=7574 RepID=A0A1S3J4A4_LINAN|nr:prefoldin subunit 1-like [Lingula anatina]XP_013419395.1 prefoldin subunit 1 [Lingula anatina]|eukprot:XP_013405108.1 prefoldin subunit 1-like [Lingula anatina]